jgi:hypothetical protein
LELRMSNSIAVLWNCKSSACVLSVENAIIRS